MTQTITIARGDGIGPEIMDATQNILEKSGADLQFETIHIGKTIYEQGITSGIDSAAWDILKKNKILLKAPITTPQGCGMKSLNVTLRKTFGLYANVRPCLSYAPYIQTKHPNMDLVIIRENEEGLYGGIEHQQTPEMVQCLRLLSVPGCQRIARFAFEYAKQNHRHKVSCFTKDNIMKQTDGLFRKIYQSIGMQYETIDKEHWIIDIGTAKLANQPEQFDVIVVPNLYGDIISDVAAEITGSVGLAGSANIGSDFAMFEAIHGSAPDIAGQGIANPSGLLQGALIMLVHLRQVDVAERIHNAWLTTIESGIHTVDIYSEAQSVKKVGTTEFAQAVIDRLDQKPNTLKSACYPKNPKPIQVKYDPTSLYDTKRELVGVDVFIYQRKPNVNTLSQACLEAQMEDFVLKIISNRGTKVWPQGDANIFCVDHWACRFMAKKNNCDHKNILKLLNRLSDLKLEFIKTELLYTFDGNPGYAKAQGE